MNVRHLGEKLIIRKADPEDAPRMLKLWQDLGEWIQKQGIDQWRPDRFSIEEIHGFFRDGADLYVAEVEDDLVGTYLILWSDPLIWGELNNTDSGYIHRLAVDRRYRGQNVGHVLLRSAEERIAERGKDTARLDCKADNPKLNRYYRENGYQLVKRLDAEGWSANLYEKRLY